MGNEPFVLYMKQLRWQILVVVVTLGIVAVLLFSQQSPVTTGPFLPQPEQGGIYTEGLIGSLGRLNPLLDWNNAADRAVDRLLFSGLIKFDSHGLPQGDLAQGWGISADGTLYNFSLREDAVWHDGTPVTSDDVIFTIDRIKSAVRFSRRISRICGARSKSRSWMIKTCNLPCRNRMLHLSITSPLASCQSICLSRSLPIRLAARGVQPEPGRHRAI